MRGAFGWLVGVLMFGTGCERAPARTPEPPAGADCAGASARAQARPGQLVLVLGRTPKPAFELTDLLLLVDGRANDQRQALDQTEPLVLFSETKPAQAHSIVVVAGLSGRGDEQGLRWKVPFVHSVTTDGASAMCVDIQLRFVDARDSPYGERPHLQATDVPLTVPSHK